MEELGIGRRPIVMPHYPHLLAEDTGVWTKFLEKNAELLKEVWYDVRVGKPVVLQEDASDMERRIAAGLTRKRIDVVCSVDDGFWVVEIKPYASMLAVGQVASYVRLFEKEYKVTGKVIPVIVCDTYDLDLLDEFEELGILVFANE